MEERLKRIEVKVDRLLARAESEPRTLACGCVADRPGQVHARGRACT